MAGVPNRVYYRIEALADEAQKKDGQVIVKASNGVIYQSAKKQQAGSFTFTPDANETYTAEITGPPASAIKAPFAKLGIKSDGVVLHAPASVGREGEPMEVILRNQGSARRLVLQVTCRGQIVDQQYLDLQPGSLSVKLQPAPGTAGVLRVTALEAGTASLRARRGALTLFAADQAPGRFVSTSPGPRSLCAGQQRRNESEDFRRK